MATVYTQGVDVRGGTQGIPYPTKTVTGARGWNPTERGTSTPSGTDPRRKVVPYMKPPSVCTRKDLETSPVPSGRAVRGTLLLSGDGRPGPDVRRRTRGRPTPARADARVAAPAVSEGRLTRVDLLRRVRERVLWSEKYRTVDRSGSPAPRVRDHRPLPDVDPDSARPRKRGTSRVPGRDRVGPQGLESSRY